MGHLVLTRKDGECILIGDDSVKHGDYIIKVTVITSKGGSVRLLFDAPNDIKIIRGELTQKETSHETHDSKPGENVQPCHSKRIACEGVLSR